MFYVQILVSGNKSFDLVVLLEFLLYELINLDNVCKIFECILDIFFIVFIKESFLFKSVDIVYVQING